MPTYEQVLQWIAELTPPNDAEQRIIRWVTDAKVVGISKTDQNRIEIFLVGPHLAPLSRSIRDAIEFQAWWHRDSPKAAFNANRLLLPAASYFDQIAAFLCTELIRAGADHDLERAFKEAEPVIELAIERLRLSDKAFLGLAGELLLLSAIARLVDDVDVAGAIDAWTGWRQSLRDFTWGTVGAEVKTTTRSISTHQIRGVHQVELIDDATSRRNERLLYLVSVGLQPTAPHENSFTVPRLVDGINARLSAVGRQGAVDAFLAHVKEYGSESGFGYDHRTMSGDAVFSRSFATIFVRAYDMTDENVAVLRRADVLRREHVDPDSLSYRVNLPPRVSGDLNPIVGLNQTALAILGKPPPL